MLFASFGHLLNDTEPSGPFDMSSPTSSQWYNYQSAIELKMFERSDQERVGKGGGGPVHNCACPKNVVKRTSCSHTAMHELFLSHIESRAMD